MGSTAVSFVVATAVAGLLVPAIVPWLRRRDLLDRPDHRTSHTNPTPRGGGLAFLAATPAAVIAASGFHDRVGLALTVAAIAGGLLGAAEDLRGIEATGRLAAQFGIGVAGCGIAGAVFHDGALAVTVISIAGAAWFAALVNGVNFMDGINGISGAYSVVVGGYFAWLGNDIDVPALAAGGALLAGLGLGFLPYNVPAAKVFMGDSGSYLVGALSAVCVVVAFLATEAPVVALAPVVYYLLDTGVTILRRWRRGESLMAPHRSHAYQRISRCGWSHAQVSVFVGAVMAGCAVVGGVVWSARDGRGNGAADVLAGIAIVVISSAVLAVAEWVERGSAIGRAPT